jgi:hypothetical protein
LSAPVPPPMGQPAAQSNVPMILGILGIVFDICCVPVGLTLGIVSFIMAKQRGQSQTLGLVAIILGVALVVVNGILLATGHSFYIRH